MGYLADWVDVTSEGMQAGLFRPIRLLAFLSLLPPDFIEVSNTIGPDPGTTIRSVPGTGVTRFFKLNEVRVLRPLESIDGL